MDSSVFKSYIQGGILQICSYCTDNIHHLQVSILTFNSNKKCLKSMRDEHCKLSACSRRGRSWFCQSASESCCPFAFPMLRCTAPEERTPATTSPPWPPCCLLYCSVLACLGRDFPCRGEQRHILLAAHFQQFFQTSEGKNC